MKTRFITWLIIACILFLAVVAHEPKKTEVKKTTIKITCPQTQCVKTKAIPDTGVLHNNQ